MIGGDIHEGSGSGCLAPRACEVRGPQPVLISINNISRSKEKKAWPNVIPGVQLDRFFLMSLFGTAVKVEIELACCCGYSCLHAVSERLEACCADSSGGDNHLHWL